MTLNVESMTRQTRVKILTAELMKAQAIADHFEYQLAALDKPEADTKGNDLKTPETVANKIETKKSGKPSPTTKKIVKPEPVVEPENEVEDAAASEEDTNEAETFESNDTESEESAEISDDEIRVMLIDYAKRKKDPTAAAKVVAKYKVQKSKQLNQRQRAEIKHMVEGFK
jgi:hypothetical protein